MIIILTKSKEDNKVNCEVSIASEGIHAIGTLHFPNQVLWARFLGALQRGSVGLRDIEVRLDVAEAKPAEEIVLPKPDPRDNQPQFVSPKPVNPDSPKPTIGGTNAPGHPGK